MNIKTITNQSSLTIIIIAIMLLISGALENAKAQTYRDRDNDGLIEISNIEQLDSIRYNRTGICSSTCSGYELTRSLDFKSTSSYRDTTGKLSAFTKGSGWDPIGSCTYHCVYGDEFNTTFEGNGYTIDNLYINRPSNSDVGLFGYTKNNSRIRNIGLRNVSISGSRLVGGLVGQNYGYITQSYATGSVSGNSYYVGGLVGNNFGKIMQSYFTGVVSGESVVGGLVGINSIDITQSYATGSVSGNSTFVGGLVGYNSTSGTITQSSSTESASGSSSVAGLVGNNFGKIMQSYSVSASDNIQELGPGFLYRQGLLPAIHKGARITVNGVNFTQLIPSSTNIGASSTVTNVIQGTGTTRATVTVDGINFTANVIGITNITTPYTITNIQNGTGKNIVGKYSAGI